MKNDGWHDIDYQLTDDSELNENVSNILNKACHVFHLHADGGWKELYKPKYADMLAECLLQRKSLIRKLLKLRDPVVSNITYAAIEVMKKDS